MRTYINTITALAATVSVFISCSRDNVHFLQVDGSVLVQNMATGRYVGADSPFAPMIAVKHGDLIGIDNACFIKYDDQRDKKITFNKRRDRYYSIDQQLATLLIDKDSGNFLDSIFEMSTDHLQSIYFNVIVDSSMIPSLKKISNKTPSIGLLYADESEDSTGNSKPYYNGQKLLFDIFDPDWLVTYTDKDHLDLLAQEQQIDMLYLMIEDSIINYTLPHMRNLKHLTIVAENADSLPTNFLMNNPELTDLVVNSEIPRGFFTGLKKIRSIDLSPQPSYAFDIRNRSSIERFSIDGDGYISAAELSNYPNLTWLSLPEDETQSAFDSLVKTHPGIRLIELSAGASINDVSKAGDWHKLKGMTIYGDSLYEKKGLTSLNRLKLLSLPDNVFEDSARIKQLRKALPDTTIVPNSGACVGTAWLLLLIPLIIAMQFAFRKKAAL